MTHTCSTPALVKNVNFSRKLSKHSLQQAFFFLAINWVELTTPELGGTQNHTLRAAARKITRRMHNQRRGENGSRTFCTSYVSDSLPSLGTTKYDLSITKGIVNAVNPNLCPVTQIGPTLFV